MGDYMARLEKIEKELDELKNDIDCDKDFTYISVYGSLKDALERVNDAVYALDVATKFNGNRAEVGDAVEITALLEELTVTGIREDGKYELAYANGGSFPLTCANYEICKNITKDISYE